MFGTLSYRDANKGIDDGAFFPAVRRGRTLLYAGSGDDDKSLIIKIIF